MKGPFARPAIRAKQDQRRSAPIKAACVLGATFLAAVIPLIFFAHSSGRGEVDEIDAHLPAIRQFARDWPRFNLSDYRSTTTPGYHLAVATVDRFLSDNIHVLRLAGVSFSILFLGILAAAVARETTWGKAVILCLPMTCSLYVISSAIWLLPDNAAWASILLILLLAWRPKVDVWTFLGGGLLLLLAVFLRQVNVWTMAILLTAAWLGSKPHLSQLHDDPHPTLRRAALMGVAVLPGVLLLGYFAWLWHGLVPPTYQYQHQGPNPAVPAVILAITGVIGLFFLSLLGVQIRQTRGQWKVILGSAVFGGVIALAPATSYNIEAGRFSGIWNVVARMPTYMDRSPLIVALAILGAAILAAWWVALDHRDGWIFAVAWLAFIAAQTANREAWQRYYEPFILMIFPLAAIRLRCRADEGNLSPIPRWALAGPALLALLLATVTAVTLMRG